MRRIRWILPIAVFVALAIIAVGKPPVAAASTESNPWAPAMREAWINVGYVQGANARPDGTRYTMFRFMPGNGHTYGCTADNRYRLFCIDSGDGVVYRAHDLYNLSSWTVATEEDDVRLGKLIGDILLVIAAILGGGAMLLVLALALWVVKKIIFDRKTQIDDGLYMGAPNLADTVTNLYLYVPGLSDDMEFGTTLSDPALGVATHIDPIAPQLRSMGLIPTLIQP